MVTYLRAQFRFGKINTLVKHFIPAIVKPDDTLAKSIGQVKKIDFTRMHLGCKASFLQRLRRLFDSLMAMFAQDVLLDYRGKRLLQWAVVRIQDNESIRTK